MKIGLKYKIGFVGIFLPFLGLLVELLGKGFGILLYLILNPLGALIAYLTHGRFLRLMRMHDYGDITPGLFILNIFFSGLIYFIIGILLENMFSKKQIIPTSEKSNRSDIKNNKNWLMLNWIPLMCIVAMFGVAFFILYIFLSGRGQLGWD